MRHEFMECEWTHHDVKSHQEKTLLKCYLIMKTTHRHSKLNK